MALRDTFIGKLAEFNITLEEETVEYLSEILQDLQLSDLRESTETFLIDANTSTEAIQQFYESIAKTAGTQGQEKAKEDHREPKKLQKSQSGDSSGDTEPESKGSTSVRKSAPRRTRRAKKAEGQQRQTGQDESEEPDIVAISQQSRFHLETLETQSTEIDLRDVQLSVNQVDLLVDAKLKLKTGTRYGLVGQNGVGKTVLMKCMADGLLVGLPKHVNILHIAQLQIQDENKSVLDEVLSADKRSTTILREGKMLQEAQGQKLEDTEGLYRVVYQILVSRARDRLDEANKLATRRSGTRGHEARQELIKREKEMAEILAKTSAEVVNQEVANQVVGEVFERLELVDEEELRVRAQKILRGVGFTEEQLQASVSTFSGGWRMKIALAKSLFMEPDVLLLDEPTNHLDLPAILWLQEYLCAMDNGTTLVVVSHDRAFLNAVTEETIIFRDQKLKYHAGNYEDWEKNTEEQRIRKQALLDAQERRKKSIMASIQYNLQQAKSTGDEKRLGQVASRKKKLDRLGMEKTEDGRRFKLKYRAGWHEHQREQIVVEQAVKTAAIKIADPPPLRYNGPHLLGLKEVSFGYDKSKKILDRISLDIEPSSRIAFLGGNGCGKTTLLNLLTRQTQPQSGEVYQHPLLRIGYFSQHIVDQLPMDMTPVEAMMQQFPDLSEHDCRAHFGTLGIGSIVTRPIAGLSGGQRSRVAFALMLYRSPHVMVLDEITNHLDMGTVEHLVEALAGYSGALILVSHDVWFMKQLLSEDDNTHQMFVVKNGHVVPWRKSIDDYVASVLRQVKKNM
ncbi:hypothetical protein EC973_004121 [Apophysomyces ossiformis]|uniref:ABC transporter domain-containing protein n=1 Tax=Apophysomyces ossiformis TaxID=679940 RepID=A0A8H7BGC3_9FUNG|nr:hypothetical protein EC973_004121 [Apophysomyces ossiformis]